MMRLSTWRGRAAFAAGMFLTLLWLYFFSGYVDAQFGWANVRFMLPHDIWEDFQALLGCTPRASDRCKKT